MASEQQEPFRLLDLPQELQDRIYKAYLGDVNITIMCHNNKTVCVGCPSLKLEQACRKVCTDVRSVRSQIVSKQVCVTSDPATDFTVDSLVREQAQSDKYQWVREHATSLYLTKHQYTTESHVDWSEFVSGFPNTREILYVSMFNDSAGWDELQSMVRDIRSGKSPAEITHREMRTPFNQRKEIAVALENKLGKGNYQVYHITQYLLIASRSSSTDQNSILKMLSTVVKHSVTPEAICMMEAWSNADELAAEPGFL